jgi:ubiquinone/menaquinone biosynthesis C-methylase UbiE
MLTKKDGHYGLTLDSSVFLDKRSPAYIGGATEFMCSPMLTEGSKHMTEAVRKGGTAMEGDGTLGPDHPIWVKFARGMAPMMAMPAQLMAPLVDPNADQKLKILDIAAGHGLYGINFATRNKQAEVTALDWKAVLEVAKENAQRMGVADRYKTIEGSAFDVEFGTGYDLVLLTNFLHHFDAPTCETLLRKVHAALADGGRAVTLEFVPNDDRVTPPDARGHAIRRCLHVCRVGANGGERRVLAQHDPSAAAKHSISCHFGEVDRDAILDLVTALSYGCFSSEPKDQSPGNSVLAQAGSRF